MASPTRPRVFLDVTIGHEPTGRLTIELFADKTPRTCENFRQLCTGEHPPLTYTKAPFHRIIDAFMIQGGDIAAGDGTGTSSIYGGEFADENLHWRDLDAPGLVCAANRGKDTNGSQFFVTLDACPHLNGKHTVFGRVVGGEDALQRIAKVAVDESDCPREPVLIARCGELEKRRKKARPGSASASASRDRARSSRSRDRGRRRCSDDGQDVEMASASAAKTAPATRVKRRESDSARDEGLRGRPRMRSGSRSVSEAIAEDGEIESEGGQSSSPAAKHKRKRSQSPSRGMGGGARRRKSLPNQYEARRGGGGAEGEERYKPSPRRDNGYRGRRGEDGYRKGEDDRYRPSRERGRFADEGRLGGDGRLGGSGGYDEHDPPTKFKGRGIMKYKEPGRRG